MRKTKQDAMKRLRVLLSGNRMRYRAIAERLNAEGFKTPHGKKWKEANVQSFVTRHPEMRAALEPNEPEPTPPSEAQPLPAAAQLDIPFVRHILESMEDAE